MSDTGIDTALKLLSNSGPKYVLAALNDRGGSMAERWYIDFQAWDAVAKKLKKKRVWVPSKMKTPKERRKWGQEKVAVINKHLLEGFHFKAAPTAEATPAPAPEPAPRKYSLLEGIEHAIEIKQAAGRVRTKQTYKGFLGVFRQWAVNHPVQVENFSQKQAYEFLDYLKQSRGVGNTTRNNYLRQLKALLNELVRREIVSKNVCLNIGELPEETGRNIAFTREQQTNVEAYLQQFQPELYRFTRFVYFAFLRPAELLQIRLKHVDLQNRKIIVHSSISKNKKQQSVTLAKPLYELLKGMELEGLNENYYLFGRGLRPGPTSLHRNRVSDRHREVLRLCGITDSMVTLYSWKHTGVVRAFQAGLNIKLLQELLRHHSLEMTDIYLKSLGLTINKEVEEKSW